MMMAKIAVVTRISASVKQRWKREWVRRVIGLSPDFGRVEEGEAAAVGRLVPRHINSYLCELRGGDGGAALAGSAGSDDHADRGAGELGRGDLLLPRRQVAARGGGGGVGPGRW